MKLERRKNTYFCYFNNSFLLTYASFPDEWIKGLFLISKLRWCLLRFTHFIKKHLVSGTVVQMHRVMQWPKELSYSSWKPLPFNRMGESGVGWGGVGEQQPELSWFLATIEQCSFCPTVPSSGIWRERVPAM